MWHSSLVESSSLAQVKEEGDYGMPGLPASAYGEIEVRVKRCKVFDNGYAYRFDKEAVDGSKSFYRCERKPNCPARVHVDNATRKIVRRLKDHNHPGNGHTDYIATPGDIVPLMNVISQPPMDSPDDQDGPFITASPRIIGDLDDIIMMNESSAHEGSAAASMHHPAEEQLGYTFGGANEEVRRSRRKRKMSEEEEGGEGAGDVERERKELFRMQPEEFDVVFRLTKRVYEMVKKECLQESAAAAALHCRKTFTPNLFKVYVAPDTNKSLFQMLRFTDCGLTMRALRSQLINKGLLHEGETSTLCTREDSLDVQLCDEILQEWQPNSSFILERQNFKIVFVAANSSS